MILYAVPHSLYCAKTRILLRAKGITWQERMPVEDRAGFTHASPFGNLPAVLHDGFALSDSEAIAEYIEEAFPSPALLPSGLQDRAKMRERGRFHDTRLEPAVRLLFPLVAAPDAKAAAQAGALIEKRLEQLATLLDHSLPFGLGDCGFAPSFLWIDLLLADMGLTVAWPQAVLAYRAWLESVPLVADEMAAYRPHALDWMREKHALRVG